MLLMGVTNCLQSFDVDQNFITLVIVFELTTNTCIDWEDRMETLNQMVRATQKKKKIGFIPFINSNVTFVPSVTNKIVLFSSKKRSSLLYFTWVRNKRNSL